MNKRPFLTVLLLAGMVIVLGCGPLSSLSNGASTPPPPDLIFTEIAGTQTALAADTARAITETALHAPSPTRTPLPSKTPRPSETPRPTWTASITPSPTVTFVINIPAIYTRKPSPTPGYTHQWRPLPGYQAANGCDLVGLLPEWGAEFDKGESFNAAWTFANYGPYNWNDKEVDFIYVKGDKLTPETLFDLWKTTMPDDRITITVPMTAPSSTGTFTTVWRLHEGDRFYCEVSIMIHVK